MLQAKANSLPASPAAMAAVLAAGVALALSPMVPGVLPALSELVGEPHVFGALPGGGQPGGGGGGGSAPPSAPGAPPGGGRPSGSPAPTNGSPFLSVYQSGSGYQVDNSLLSQQYATPSAPKDQDTYLLQVAPTVLSGKVYLQIVQAGNYSVSLDSVSLATVQPSSGGAYAQEDVNAPHGVASTLAPSSAFDGSGSNVTTLLANPSSNASTAAGSYLSGTTGTTVLAGFGTVANAASGVVLLRMEGDPAFPPAAPSGITVEVQNPQTGSYTTISLIAPREYWATYALPLSGFLPAGSQSVVVRLVWQGDHAVSWLALGTASQALALSYQTLVSATTTQGVNVTSQLRYTDNVSAVLSPGSAVDLCYAVGSGLPAGALWAVSVNGDALTNGSGPHAAFGYAPSAPTVGQAVLFSSLSTDPNATITSYAWTFGDGSVGSGQNLSHTYAHAGNYNVTLTIQDALGLQDSALAVVAVLAASGGGGAGGVCQNAFGCYVLNVTFAVEAPSQHPFPTTNASAAIILLNNSGCGRGGWGTAGSDAGLPGMAPSTVVPLQHPSPGTNCTCQGGLGFAWGHDCSCSGGGFLWNAASGLAPGSSGTPAPQWGRPPWPQGNVSCRTLFWLNITITSSGTWFRANGTAVLPWTSGAQLPLQDLFLEVNEVPGGAHPHVARPMQWFVNFTTPLYSNGAASLGAGWGGWGGTGLNRTWVDNLNSLLYWDLGGGLLVTFDAARFLPSSGALGESWSFGAPSSAPRPCAVSNLTCVLVQHAPWGGWWSGTPAGFPARALDTATCAALNGTALGALVCGHLGGLARPHLTADPGSFTVTLTIFTTKGTLTVVQSVNEAVSD